MSEEFIKLQNLIKENKAALRTKKVKNAGHYFFLWIYWDCTTRPSILNLFGKSYLLIWYVLLNDVVWIAVSIILAIVMNNWFFLLLIAVPMILKIFILNPIGQGFIIYDAQHNEELFDDLWQNQLIGIFSVKKHESPIHKEGTPDIIIDPYNMDWRVEINRAEF